MNRACSNLLFSIAVTAVMNALDMTYHLATGWAVHLNYVAVKLTVIFLTVWMITQFIGIGKEEGIIAGIFGPFVFYVYYVFAGATLNREVFRIDEQFWFFFLHAALMIIAYFSAWSFVKSKNKWIMEAGFLITSVFFALALDALMAMIRWRLQGIDEETAAKLFTFGVILVPLLSYPAAFIGALAGKILKMPYTDLLVAAAAACVSIGFFTRDILHGIFAFLFVCIAYGTIHGFKKAAGNGA